MGRRKRCPLISTYMPKKKIEKLTYKQQQSSVG